jgi:hypothetical protein
MADIKESRKDRWKNLLKGRASDERSSESKSGETRNPLPEKEYTDKQRPYCDDEENDPEIDGR